MRFARRAICGIRGGSGRPRLLLYGESLGAKVQQAAVLQASRISIVSVSTQRCGSAHPGASTTTMFIERSTPSRSRWIDPSRSMQVLRANPTPRVWFLEHDGDPVVRFRSDLAHTRPTWLSPAQGRGVPPDMQWRIGVTWAQVLVDTLYATDISPGDFRSHGHDYRADLGAVVTEAFGLAPTDAQDGWVDRREIRLRELEVRRAEQVRGSLETQRPRAPEASSP